MTTQYQQFTAMLDGLGQGYGLRLDHKPDGTQDTTIYVEDAGTAASGDTDRQVEFLFSPDGELLSIVFGDAEKG